MTECIITMRDGGQMRFALYPDKAPITVASFAEAANGGFFDGLAFCRIVKGFVIQGGSPDNDIMTDSDFHIFGEFAENGVDTGLTHARGAISMARDEAPNTAGTQFFICHQDAHRLDGKYAAFGMMTQGWGVLDALAETPTFGKETWNKPVDMPVIASIRVVADAPLPPVKRLP
ncbi:MAG: peptidylprolyl isomerase [Clostridia bacterium]|nr:peptidylprolyl isomerase [Clostridia bacterium]